MDQFSSKNQRFRPNQTPAYSSLSENVFSSELVDLSDEPQSTKIDAQEYRPMEHLDVSAPTRLSSFDEARSSIDQADLDLRRQVAEALKAPVPEIEEFTFKRKSNNSARSTGIYNSGGGSSRVRLPAVLEREDRSSGGSGYRDDIYASEPGDWSVEGTGRRVAYDDFTTIDWIYDFAKERLRQRRLKDQKGFYAQLNIIQDAMQAWIIVFGIGVAAGILAASIDICTEWLGDLKEGYCNTGYYLNRKFCCWGRDTNEYCYEWVPWSSAVHARSQTGQFWVQYLFYIIFAMAFAGAASLLVVQFAPYARGSGISEIKTILGGFVIKGFLGVWTLLVKSIGLSLAASSGLSVGKEGPLVHIACCCGNVLNRTFRKFRINEAKKREVLSAASAAGISVAFGAPIGGVLFSLEEVSYYFPAMTMWRSFFCAMVAAVSLQLLNPFRTDKLVLFQITYDRDWHAFELVFFALLGILGGLFGAVFIRLNLKLQSYRKSSWLRKFPVEEVLIIAGVTSILGYLNHFMRPQGSELIASLFRECGPHDRSGVCNDDTWLKNIFLLVIAGCLKTILTTITFGMNVPAGILTPSMAVGACMGRALGMIVQTWQENHIGFWLFSGCRPDMQCITPGMYAMVGAAAALGGVTRITVSLVVIMFELTGALTYVLPVMVAVMISKWVGDAFGKEGIYDGIIRLNGYPYLDTKDDYKHNHLSANVMTRVEDLVVITSTGHTLDSLDEMLYDNDYKGFPVVNDTREMMLVGYISRTELRYAIDQARRKQGMSGSTPARFSGNFPILEAAQFVDLRPWVDQTPITVSHKFPMEQTVQLFRKMGLRYALVASNSRLLGLLTKKDVLRHLAVVSKPEMSSITGEEASQDETQNLIRIWERRLSGNTSD